MVKSVDIEQPLILKREFVSNLLNIVPAHVFTKTAVYGARHYSRVDERMRHCGPAS